MTPAFVKRRASGSHINKSKPKRKSLGSESSAPSPHLRFRESSGSPGLPTLEEAFPLEPIFKAVAHAAKVIRNAALQAYSPGTARPYVLNH